MDIKNHRFFKTMIWEDLLLKKIPAPYTPKVRYFIFYFIFTQLRASNDISNFSIYPDSTSIVPAIKKTDDPFLNWFN